MGLSRDSGFIKKSKSGKGFKVVDQSRVFARVFTGSMLFLEEFVAGKRDRVPLAEIIKDVDEPYPERD